MRATFLTGRFCALLSAAALAVMCQTVDAGIVTLGTSNITNNTGDIASQLKIVVADEDVNLAPLGISQTVLAATTGVTLGGNKVNFIFVNQGPVAAVIEAVYFDDGTLLGISALNPGPGVQFSLGGSPPDLPGGNPINFNTTAGFLANADSPSPHKGINPGEWLAVTFNLIGGQTLTNVLSAINLSLLPGNVGTDVTGGLRIGMHVQAIGPNSKSDSYVNGPPGSGNQEIPEPGSLTLLVLGGLGAMAVARRRRSLAA